MASYESTAQRDLVQLKCDGKAEQLIVTYTADVDPSTMQVLASKIEAGFKVQVWSSQPKQQYEVVDQKNISSSYVGVEAAIEGQQDTYHIEMPNWGNYSWDQKGESFKTRLTLKGGLAKGNIALDCKATLEKANYKIVVE